MTEIGPIQPSNLSSITPSPARSGGREVSSEQAARGDDRVEVSNIAHLMNKLANLPVRRERIDEVQADIKAGAVDTPQKLDQAIEEMLDDLEHTNHI